MPPHLMLAAALAATVPVLPAVVPARPAVPVPQAVPAVPAPACRADVCLWTGARYTGALHTWREADGNVHIGPEHADRVGSFVANAEVCFVDTADSEWSWNERRRAGAGDYSPNYLRRFGQRMDRIAPARYC
ncbi:hypothetical protein [Nonomuraea sp. NPDC003804]|uniref:hypothetical protein n=1 Tax=Nonomuraea sp. NPDC003804 TaxID=3154547 RepID=UPI0033BF64CD